MRGRVGQVEYFVIASEFQIPGAWAAWTKGEAGSSGLGL